LLSAHTRSSALMHWGPKKYATPFDTLCRSLAERRRQLSSAPSIIQLQPRLLPHLCRTSAANLTRRCQSRKLRAHMLNGSDEGCQNRTNGWAWKKNNSKQWAKRFSAIYYRL